MGQFTGISSSFYDEPEYRTMIEQAVAQYIMISRDMLGVCPVNLRVVGAKLRIRRKKDLSDVLDYFESIGKLVFSEGGTHVWWKSGAWHSLNRGKFAPLQLQGVSKLLSKWTESGLFGSSFAATVTQLYETKYQMRIPIAYPFPSETDTEANTEAEADGAASAASSFLPIDDFERYVAKHGDAVKESWERDYCEWGGSTALLQVADLLRRDIILNPDSYRPVVLNQTWGRKLKNWMDVEINKGTFKSQSKREGNR